MDQEDLVEPDESQSDEEEQKDDDNSVHSTISNNNNHFTTPPEHSTNTLQTEAAGRPLGGAGGIESLLGGLTFADLTRKFKGKQAVSEGGFRPSFGGGRGENGSDSSVSSRTKRQLAKEQHKRAVIEQLLDQLEDEAAAYRAPPWKN